LVRWEGSSPETTTTEATLVSGGCAWSEQALARASLDQACPCHEEERQAPRQSWSTLPHIPYPDLPTRRLPNTAVQYGALVPSLEVCAAAWQSCLSNFCHSYLQVSRSSFLLGGLSCSLEEHLRILLKRRSRDVSNGDWPVLSQHG
jgi:hypothetical protein